MKKELKKIHSSLTEEKQRYSTKNKEKIKKNSFELYNFFLNEEKEMLKSYTAKSKEKKKEIQKWINLKDKELFNEFSLTDRINNIKIRNKGLSSLSTNIDN